MGDSSTNRIGSVPRIAAFYYPGFHDCLGRDIRGSTSEWALLFDQVARQNYPNVRRPLTEPGPASADSIADETRLAHSMGIDAFLWCWYWDRGIEHLGGALEMFLGRDRPKGFEYALLWANKRPHFKLPIPAQSSADAAGRLTDTDEADFARMIDHLIAHHFCRPDYLKVDGMPLLMIFVVEPLVRALGAARLQRMFAQAQARACRAGLLGICFVAIWHRPPTRGKTLLRSLGLDRLAGETDIKRVGFSAVSQYIYLPEWKGESVQSYARLIQTRPQEWDLIRNHFGLPLWPTVSPGWDARSRGAPTTSPPRAYPYAPVVEGETPALFADLLRTWESFATRNGDVPILPLTSWNEWTEGHAIAPCDRHGHGMLEALSNWKTQLRIRTGSSRER